MTTHIVIAANNGDIGGGEVMLLAIAEAIRDLGKTPIIVGPIGGLADEARRRRFTVESLPVQRRPDYMRDLRGWRKNNPSGILWCNGLVPAVATAGMPNRIVHLHQLPSGVQRKAAALARLRTIATVVPSEFMAATIPGSTVLHNWSGQVHAAPTAEKPHRVRIGYLGRLSEGKGLHVLADAFDTLQQQEAGKYSLRIAGAPLFVDARERALITGRLNRLGTAAEQLGWTPAHQLFGQIDLLVVPSVFPESFGLVVTEAMSARVPVVVSNAGALPEIVGVDHPWIANAGDATNLAETISAAASELPPTDILERAHERWAAEFSPEAGRNRLSRLIDSFPQAKASR